MCAVLLRDIPVSTATAMIKITDLSSHERQQLLVPAVMALGAAGATGVLSFSYADLFRPYFGRLHPLPAVLLIGLLGFVALRVLSLRWKFKMYAGRESVKGDDRPTSRYLRTASRCRVNHAARPSPSLLGISLLLWYNFRPIVLGVHIAANLRW
jgi:hypothetical protein